ncbi:xanthine and CO dehydrogenases maturation factor, XdhC/CoxF family [Natronococcus occultus SP4]|uniref:Xanthine and CO dehydrogenases maturation factor, XdhC/CoxF family n=2 Tax=Natronococcus occultus TaxID=29288 RepID=L0K452_9EURY|nr:xanthine and CO dehydrogenases maturation factor, XdhC/CoxF family [Natronococcus occultus SP4]
MTYSPAQPWNATSRDVRRSMRRHLREESTAIVATVVSVDGSGYRRPGARTVVEPTGESTGAVTAGCLKESVIDAARKIVADGEPQLRTFDLQDDDDAWGLGLGCNGVIDILFEPLDASFRPALDELRENLPVTVLTAVESTASTVSAGDRTVLTSDGWSSTERNSLPEPVVTSIENRLDATASKATGSLSVTTNAGTIRVFVNRLTPTPTLLLFGGQEDVNPVTSLASRAGFRVHVVTARSGHADADRFPDATDVSSIRPPQLGDLVEAPSSTFAVLMSHNFIDDQLALDSLLETAVPYIGVMGPRKRFRELRESMDRTLDTADLDRIAAPCGLALGSDSPTEIGFSIVSEVLAVHNDRSGGRLTELEGPIHNRSEIG